MEKEYRNIIAMQECADGNETVGTMWIDAKSFPINTPIEEVIKWAKGRNGRLMIRPDYVSDFETLIPSRAI